MGVERQDANRSLDASVEQGLLPAEVQRAWSEMAMATYADAPQKQRDEAIRSASLAAMPLMLGAQSLGLASGAIGGFDAEGGAKAFELNESDVPVMLIAVGYASGPTAENSQARCRGA